VATSPLDPGKHKGQDRSAQQEKTMEKSFHPVRFHGDAREYFGIWIVNLLLSIVTLGIYSAWAKVRNTKYFYQNTEIAGRRFDYHATGKQILIGRVIIIVGLIAFQVLAMVPVLLVIGFVITLFLFPWLITRALRFNARVTSWSNVRFDFDGQPGRAFLVYLLYPFLTVFTLYLAWPFADRARRRYVINHHKLGRARFHFDTPVGPIYLALLGASVAGGIVVTLAMLGVSDSLMELEGMFDPKRGQPGNPAEIIFLMIRLYVGAIAAFVVGGLVYGAMMRNLIYRGTSIEGGHGLASTVSVPQYVWIGLSNALVVVSTLGLMLPWAQVRMARYLASQTEAMVHGTLDDFVGDVMPEGGALGDAYTDIEAIDLGFPV
jgi:uncharacterized membrane protein YjgN (DUF898 family)